MKWKKVWINIFHGALGLEVGARKFKKGPSKLNITNTILANRCHERGWLQESCAGALPHPPL